MDFKAAAAELLTRAHEVLPEWLPGGKLKGRYYLCADINGGAGESFSVNTDTGAWKDFATGDKGGGDLINLYAKIRNISQSEAVKELRLNGHREFRKEPRKEPRPAKKAKNNIAPPPATDTAPDMTHPTLGMPDKVWTYRTKSGDVWHYVCRWDTDKGKEVRPLSYSRDEAKWVWRAKEKNRPLYNLHELSEKPGMPVLIVEGEKAADAAEEIAGCAYTVTTWSHGSSSVAKVHWKELKDRRVLVWPDDDEAGRKAEGELRDILMKTVKEYKVIETDGDTGHDAADMLEGGMDWRGFKEWAVPKLKLVEWEKPPAPPEPEPVREEPPEPSQPEPSQPEPELIPAPGQVEEHKEKFDPNPYRDTWAEMGLTGSGNSPHSNLANTTKAIECEKYFGGKVWFDEFHQRVYTNKKFSDRDESPRPWSNIDDLRCAEYFQKIAGMFKMTDEQVAKAVATVAHREITNEPRDWMETLKWDGNDRVDTAFHEYFGTDLDDYTKAISRNFWISLVARVYEPGCQVDNMVYFKGKQGIRKTTAMRIIGGKWYGEASESIQNKDFYLCLRGKMLVEIGELNSFSKTLQPIVKQTVSRRVDTFRAPYARREEDHPRRCIFAGTTNDDDLHKDETGARRFWPAHCRKVNIKLLTQDREQLFAEAVYRYKRGDKWYQTPLKETRAVQEEHRRVDEWENIVADYTSGKERVTVAEIWTQSELQGDLSRLGKSEQMRIATALRAIGFRKKDWYELNKKGDRIKTRGWQRDPEADSRHNDGQ